MFYIVVRVFIILCIFFAEFMFVRNLYVICCDFMYFKDPSMDGIAN